MTATPVIVRRIDHVTVEAEDIAPMYGVLTDVLGLPAVLPDCARVWVGDTVLAIRAGRSPVRIAAIALEARRTEDGPDDTRIKLHGLAGEDVRVFLCAAEHRPQVAVTGGELGVTGVADVVIGSTDMAGTCRRWQVLLHPSRPVAQGLWKFEAGPSLRVVPGGRNEVLGLRLRVASLGTARAFLDRIGALGAIGAEGVAIDASLLLGLEVVLVE